MRALYVVLITAISVACATGFSLIETLGTMPSPGGYVFSGCAVGNRAYLSMSNHVSTTVLQFDLSTRQTTLKSDWALSAQRNLGAAACSSNYVYFAGGQCQFDVWLCA